MWITTSKHAGIGLKQLAKRLARSLPGGRMERRGEQGLERIEELAGREAEDTILVLSASNPSAAPSSSFILRSRQRKDGAWTWQAQEMVVEELKETRVDGKKSPDASPLPYSITTQGAQASKIAAFLGLREHPLARFYAERDEYGVEAETREGRFAISSGGKSVIGIHFGWRALCEKD